MGSKRNEAKSERADIRTPGPWMPSITPIKYGNESAWTVEAGASLTTVAICTYARGDEEGRRAAFADATLIAAAPDMLDMLQKHLDWFDGKFLPVNEAEFIAATRAAIAKAVAS